MAFKTVQIIDAECVSETGCTPAASTVDVDDQPTEPINQQGQAEFGPVSQDENLFNFVASDKTTCEFAIQSRLHITQTCTLGGGCGQYCGVPSSSCQSANPQLYGACIAY